MNLLRAAALAAGAVLLSACFPAGEDTAAVPRTESRPDATRAGTPSAAERPGGSASPGGGATSGDGRAPSPDEPPGTTGRARVPRPPENNRCYRLRLDALARPTSDAEPMSCRDRHTVQTFFVGEIDALVDGHLVAVDSQRVQEQLTRACPRRLAEYLGGDAATRALSRFRAVWFAPTVEESDRGARWYRCDLVAFATGDRLLPLPPPRRLRGVLDDPAALDEYGLCGTAAPGSRGFQRVACGRPHSWRAIATLPLDGGDSYPGRSTVREAGDQRCRDRVESLLGEVDRFTYGWEWPTRDQWRRGQRHGYCWAPTR